MMLRRASARLLSAALLLGSTGLRGLVRARNAVGEVTVRGAGPWTRRVFEAASLDSLFRFEG